MPCLVHKASSSTTEGKTPDTDKTDAKRESREWKCGLCKWSYFWRPTAEDQIEFFKAKIVNHAAVCLFKARQIDEEAKDAAEVHLNQVQDKMARVKANRFVA
jgi:hypothetical protein